VPGCQKLQMTLLNTVWHRMLYSCTQGHMATVGVKGLKHQCNRNESANSILTDFTHNVGHRLDRDIARSFKVGVHALLPFRASCVQGMAPELSCKLSHVQRSRHISHDSCQPVARDLRGSQTAILARCCPILDTESRHFTG